MKYTIKEFAREIRIIYPRDYDDLSDRNLLELWLKKYPNDRIKVDLEQINQSDISQKSKSFAKYILLAVLLVIGYFTKPSVQDHKNTILDEVLYPIADKVGTEVGISDLASLNIFGVDVHAGIKEYLDNSHDITFKDYYFISTTEYDSHTVSYGAFGIVYIPPQVKNEMNNQVKSMIDNAKSFLK